MSNIRQRSSKSKNGDVSNGHSHLHQHTKSSSLSSILHTHSHSHGTEDDEEDEEEHTGEAMMLLDALRGRGDDASRVTLLGLAANIGLTVLKGSAGWYLNSAALIADAGHSLSDLIADLVTLSTIIISQRPPSPLYPLGYGKLESLGTVTVSVFLLLGGLGIGAHSWGMLSQTLASHPNLPPFLHSLLDVLSLSPESGHGHHHGPDIHEGEDLSPSAIFFPIFGMLVKEYLYRVTKVVAEKQNSSVLMANALHHRSDAFSSIVTVVAILGSIFLKGVPVDPMGGILVALLILLSSVRIFKGAILELTDASIAPSTLSVYRTILSQVSTSSKQITNVDDIRAVRSGSSVFVDVDITVKDGLSAKDVLTAIDDLKTKLRERKEVKEVRVSFRIDA